MLAWRLCSGLFQVIPSAQFEFMSAANDTGAWDNSTLGLLEAGQTDFTHQMGLTALRFGTLPLA